MLAEDDPKTVLVVDDTPENIDILKGILGPYFSVRAATSGETALKAARAGRRPDLILLDVMLPQMDGIELVRQLADLVDLQQTPVVFLTGHLQPERLQELRQLGVRQVLGKPFDPLQLATQLRQIWEAEHG